MRLPLLALLIAVFTTASAADIPPGIEAKLSAERAAAAQAAQATKTGKMARTALVATRSLGATGTIAIGSVAIVTPADPAAVPRFSKIELLVTIPTLAATRQLRVAAPRNFKAGRARSRKCFVPTKR